MITGVLRMLGVGLVGASIGSLALALAKPKDPIALMLMLRAIVYTLLALYVELVSHR